MRKVHALMFACAAGFTFAASEVPKAAAEQAVMMGKDASECQIAASLGVAKPGCPALAPKRPGTRGLAIGNIDQMPAPPPAAAPRPAAAPTGAIPTAAPMTATAAPPPAMTPAHSEYKAAFQINFDFGRASLTSDARRILDRVGSVIKDSGSVRFRIAGHTDSVGSADRNLVLSQERAASVVEYLTSRFGITPSRLEAIGMGENEPINPANPAAGENRRVEITNLGG